MPTTRLFPLFKRRGSDGPFARVLSVLNFFVLILALQIMTNATMGVANAATLFVDNIGLDVPDCTVAASPCRPTVPQPQPTTAKRW